MQGRFVLGPRLAELATAAGEDRLLVGGPERDYSPAWSPDGSQIAYATREGDEAYLMVVDADGSNPRRVASNVYPDDPGVVWSPDGSQIAYMTNYAVNDGSGEIWVMDAGGQNQRQLTHNVLDDGSPIWSPDGRYLAFSAGTLPPDIRRALYVYDLDADRLVQLTPSDGLVSSRLVWSPDSEWIIFITHHDDNSRTLDLIRRDGSDAHTVLDAGGDLYFWLP